MNTPKTLRLPRPKDLQSNSLEALQKHFEILYDELDRVWRLLWGDLHTIQVDSDGWIYFGGMKKAGSARVGLNGTAWECQHYIDGEYKGRLSSSP